MPDMDIPFTLGGRRASHDQVPRRYDWATQLGFLSRLSRLSVDACDAIDNLHADGGLGISHLAQTQVLLTQERQNSDGHLRVVSRGRYSNQSAGPSPTASWT